VRGRGLLVRSEALAGLPVCGFLAFEASSGDKVVVGVEVVWLLEGPGT